MLTVKVLFSKSISSKVSADASPPRSPEKARRAKSYLKFWGGYQEHAQELNEYDQQRAAILFHTLSEMTKNELKFLSLKYVTGNVEQGNFFKQVPLSDSILVAKLGITTNECRKKRLVIEKRMEEKLSKFVDLIELRTLEEATAYLLCSGRLYYKAHKGDDVIFTTVKMWAKVFPRDSNEGMRIQEAFGLDKIPETEKSL